MALQKTNVSLSFKQGLDTKTDPKQVVFGKLLNLLNGKFISPNRIQKRNGYTTVGPALPSANGVDVVAYNNELVSFDGSQVYSYSQETNTQITKGAKIAVDLETSPIIRNNYYQINPDSAIHSNGLQMFVYADSQDKYTIRYSLIDTATGNFIKRDVALVTTANSWKVKVVGNYFVISYTDQTGSVLSYKAMDATNPVSFVSATLVSDIALYYDVCVLGTKLYFSYINNVGSVSMFTLDSSLVKSTNTVVTIGTTPRILTTCSDVTTNEIYVLLQDTANSLIYFVRNSSLGSVVPVNTITMSVPACLALTITVNNGNGFFFYDNTELIATGGTNISRIYNYVTSSKIVAKSVIGYGFQIGDVQLASKAFQYNGVSYCPVFHSSTQQSTYFVINELCSAVTKIAYSNSSFTNQFPILSESNKISATEFQFPYLYKDLTTSIASHIYSQAGINSANLMFNSLLDNKILANDVHISGGILSMYDGANVVEHGFNLYPEYLYSTGSLANGQMEKGSYQYCAVYEWMDNQGNIHKSAPSTPITQEMTTFSFTGQTNSGSATINTVNSEAAKKLYIGMIVTGPGIAANSKIVAITSSTVDLDKNATATALVTLEASPNTNLSITNPNGNSFVTTGVYQFNVYAEWKSGDTFITVYNPQGLKVGMNLKSPSYPYFGVNFLITGIVGNKVYISGGALASTYTNVALSASFIVSGTATNLSNIITATDRDYRTYFRVGDLLTNFSGRFTGSLQITAMTATTITLSSAATSSGSLTCNYVMPPSWTLYPGKILTSTNTNIPGPYVIKSVIDITPVVGDLTTASAAIVTLEENMPAVSGTVIFEMTNGYTSYLAIPYLQITDKQNVASPVIVSIYRTAKNATIFYRCSSLISPNYNSTNINTPYLYFSDGMADSILEGNDQLYTTGGEVENIAAPATAIMTSFKNRLIAVPQENKFQFWYSKQVIPGTPVEFSDVFVQNVDQRGGEITALGAMDDKLIIFKQTSIYYIVGDGPTPAGTFNDFSLPILITADAGCVNKKSIVVMPEGLMFKSAKGIYLLSRALELKYIGADVEAYNAYDVTSAQLIPSVYEVRFTLTNGVCLVHDYYVDQWSVYDNIAAVDSTIFQGKYTYLKENGTILQEQSGVYTDNGNFIQLSLTTSWLSFAGLQGYERFYDMLLLGDYKSPHTLNIEFAYDFNNSATQLTQIPVTSDPGVYQYRIFPVTQKCEAFKLTIYDTQDTSFGEGFDISALIMRVGAKTGTQKMPASSAYG